MKTQNICRLNFHDVNAYLLSASHPYVHNMSWQPSSHAVTFNTAQPNSSVVFFKPSTSASKRQFTGFLLDPLPTCLFTQLRLRWYRWCTQINYHTTYHLDFHKLKTSGLLLLTPVTSGSPGFLPELQHLYTSACSHTSLSWNKLKRDYCFPALVNRLLKLRNRRLNKAAPKATKPAWRQQGSSLVRFCVLLWCSTAQARVRSTGEDVCPTEKGLFIKKM